MKNHVVFLVVGIMLLLTSCSIEKRHYMNGYNVQWKNNNNAKSSVIASSEELTASALKETNPLEAPVLFFDNTVDIKEDSCDLIQLKNHTEVKAKVMEINTSSIVYKDCDNINGEEKTIRKGEVAGITYRNGVKEAAETFKVDKTQEAINFKEAQKANPQKVRGQKLPLHPKARMAIIFGPMSFIPFCGWVFAIISLIYALIAWLYIDKNPGEYRGKKQAVIGGALGLLGLILGILIVAVLLLSL